MWSYWSIQFAFYRALRGLGQDVDIVPVDRGLDAYRAVVVPALHLVDLARADRLRDYVAAGGHLVLGPRSGAKDMTGLAHSPAPGPLADVTGAHCYRVDALRPGLVTSTNGLLGRLEFRVWADLLVSQGAEVLARYDDAAYAGSAAITQNDFGTGTCTWIGAWYDDDAMAIVLEHLLAAAGLATVRLPDGIRTCSVGRPTVMNYSDQAVSVAGTQVSSLDVAFLEGGDATRE